MQEKLLDEMQIIADAHRILGWEGAREVGRSLGWIAGDILIHKGGAEYWSNGPSWSHLGFYRDVCSLRESLRESKNLGFTSSSGRVS